MVFKWPHNGLDKKLRTVQNMGTVVPLKLGEPMRRANSSHVSYSDLGRYYW